MNKQLLTLTLIVGLPLLCQAQTAAEPVILNEPEPALLFYDSVDPFILPDPTIVDQRATPEIEPVPEPAPEPVVPEPVIPEPAREQTPEPNFPEPTLTPETSDSNFNATLTIDPSPTPTTENSVKQTKQITVIPKFPWITFAGLLFGTLLTLLIIYLLNSQTQRSKKSPILRQKLQNDRDSLLQDLSQIITQKNPPPTLLSRLQGEIELFGNKELITAFQQYRNSLQTEDTNQIKANTAQLQELIRNHLNSPDA